MKIASINILILILLISSCSTTNKTNFVEDKSITQDATFTAIKSNVARLHAMMCGAFVQYNMSTDSTNMPKYTPWKVNDGKDSVMLYTIPVDDPSKSWLLGLPLSFYY